MAITVKKKTKHQFGLLSSVELFHDIYEIQKPMAVFHIKIHHKTA